MQSPCQWVLGSILDIVERFYGADLNQENVFSKIYTDGTWGDGSLPFYSGPGSHDDSIVLPYLEIISKLIESRNLQNMRFVDLGCGDFNIGRSISSMVSSYHGIDIDPNLIKYNSTNFSSIRIADGLW